MKPVAFVVGLGSVCRRLCQTLRARRRGHDEPRVLLLAHWDQRVEEMQCERERAKGTTNMKLHDPDSAILAGAAVGMAGGTLSGPRKRPAAPVSELPQNRATRTPQHCH
jgi:hypothetical protein